VAYQRRSLGLIRLGTWMLLSAVGAGAAERAVTVGVADFPPNVMQSAAGEEFEGFDIDLWREVARIVGVDYTFRLYPFKDLLEAVRAGEVEVGLAGITITEEREAGMDFSYPYMHTGLRILIRPTQEASLTRLLRSALTSTILKTLAYLVGFLVLCAHILYFVERGSGSVNRRYFPGVFEAAWCILATMTTVGYGDIAPKRWAGRLVAFLVMVTGIALFGLIVADLSAGLTLQHFTSDINSAEDLRGRSVATVADSTSVAAAGGYGARIREVKTIEDAYQLLLEEQVDAVVFDAAPLMKHVREAPPGQVALVGPLLHPQNYGIAFPSNSPLREQVNRALLRIEENNTYEELYKRWFGSEPE